MTVSASATLDANIQGANGAEITLTTETMLTLFVMENSGSHDLRRVTIEFSPDGTNWFKSSYSINGHGNMMNEERVAERARVCVCKAEGAPSTVDVFLLAR